MDRMFREAMGLVESAPSLEIVPIAIARLDPRPQPRRYFGTAGLEALAESIRVQGVLEPLLVRPIQGERYEIIAGERRYRAAQLAGLETVPAIVLNVDEPQAKTLSLLENLQREDLNPYEETLGILDLLELKLGKTRDEAIRFLQKMLNKSKGKVTHNVMGNDQAQVESLFRLLGKMSWQSFVQNRLPLLSLPQDLKQALEEGAIAYTVALELKKVTHPRLRKKLLEEARAGLSLRELRAKVRQTQSKPHPKPHWYRQALDTLRKIKPESLSEERQEKIQALIQELVALLEHTP